MQRVILGRFGYDWPDERLESAREALRTGEPFWDAHPKYVVNIYQHYSGDWVIVAGDTPGLDRSQT